MAMQKGRNEDMMMKASVVVLVCLLFGSVLASDCELGGYTWAANYDGDEKGRNEDMMMKASVVVLVCLLFGSVLASDCELGGYTWAANYDGDAEGLRMQLYSDHTLFAYRAIGWTRVDGYECGEQNQLTGSWAYNNSTEFLAISYDDCDLTGCSSDCLCTCDRSGFSGTISWDDSCRGFLLTEEDGTATHFRRTWSLVWIIVVIWLALMVGCACCSLCTFGCGACCFVAICYCRTWASRTEYETVTTSGPTIAVYENL
eukprot:CAMPEP_0114618346 /NCGR_PEP_ID=MMETSP0168-20121206/7656_1 /TAXON_ID=95228 ORGANISM="Vannella sp., Strain DIVA3 517/6/12" /NCGR_SAMPLE_ID=MMETSP0168 /ASSEMBLY_ACC=CAM_ASM_000044 /LENGTH=257 /DNA_ID=CAMNT_0001829491 /DNA_START=14 /DNA_END=788 /DNA_ORIENTATION=+